MQLKTVGESLNVLKIISSVSDTQQLSIALSSYSTEAIKSAIAQSTLNETQIRAILIEKGFTGQLLETTTAELAQATATNALTASEGAATGATVGFMNAIRGLGATIKSFVLAHPILTAIAAVGATIYGAVKAVDYFNVTLEEQQEITKDLQGELSEIQSGIEDVNAELKTTADRIDELNSKDSLSFVEKEELENLKAENDELERKNRLLAEQEADKKKDVADSVKEEYDKEHGNDYYQRITTWSDMKSITSKRNRYSELSGKYDLSDDEYEEMLRLQAEIYNWETKVSSSFPEHIQEVINAYDELNQRKKSGKELSEEDEKQLEAWRTELVDTAVDLDDYVDRYGIDDETSQSWHNLSVAISECLYPADTLTEKFNEVFNGLSDDVQKELTTLAKEGSLSADDLSDGIKEAFEEAGFTANEVIEQIMAGVKGLSEKDVDVKTNSSFSEAFNSADFADTKEKLLDLARSGELTPSTLSSTEDYAKLLSETGLSAEEAANEIFDLLSVQEKLAAASNGMDKLKSAYEEFKDLGFVTASALESLPDAFKELDGFDLFSEIAGDPTQGTEKIQEAFNEIVKQYILAQDTLSALTGASNSEIQSYIANLKEMNITNAEEVVNQIVNVLSQENQMLNEAEAEYMEYLLNKDTLDTDYLESVTTKNSQLVSALGKPYQSDYENWCDLLTKKSEAYNEFVTRIGGSYDAALGAAGNLQSNGKEVNSRTLQEYYTYKSNYDQATIEAQKKKDELKLDLATIDTSFNTSFSPKPSGSGSSGSSSSSESETIETFDFIETTIKRIEAAIDKVKSKAEDTFRSFSSRSKSYAETIKKMTDEIALQEQAKQKYIERRDSIGLDEYWAAQVRDGSLNIADITDDALKEQINAYGEWNDKVIECTESVSNLKKEQKELVRESIELLITKYGKLETKASNAAGKVQDRIDLKEAWGGSAKASDYNSMNKSVAKQVGYLEKQNTELKKLQKSVPRTSEAWYDYQEQIDNNSSSIQDLTKSMAENAQAAASLAKAKADLKVDKYDSKDELYNAKIENATTAKSKNSLINNEISNIGNRQKAYKTAVKTSTKKLNSSASAINGLKSKKTNTKNKTTNAENKTYNTVLKKVKAKVKKGERIGTSLLNKATGLNDDLALYNACVQYNAYLDAKEENETIAELYAETAKSEKNALAYQKFNNVAAEYGNKIQMSDYQMTALDNKISETETAGKKVERSYYDTQKKINAEKLAQYQAEKSALEESIKGIKQGTDEWYEAYDQIQQVSSSISDCVKETYELNNAINQLHFDQFNDVSESIGRIITEQEFLRGLFAHEKNTDTKTGNFTDAGFANLGSLSASYYASKERAENDGIELQKLKAILSKGVNADGTYGDADLTFNSLEDLQKEIDKTYTTWQNDIKETYSVESEIADMMKEKYQAELEMLQELINAKKEALQSEKDLHDYQQSINEKTKDITTIQKQIAAYSGDSSEEAMAKLQKLQKELADKEEDLRETEYDRYISDQEDMLNKLYEEYEELVTKKLEDFMTLVREGLDTSNSNTAIIANYFSKVAKDNGYDIETDGLFSGSSGGIGENVGKAVADIEKDKTATDDNKKPAQTGSNNSGTTLPDLSGSQFIIDTTPKRESATTSFDTAKSYIKKNVKDAEMAKNKYSAVNQKIYDNRSGAYKGNGKILPTNKLKGLAEKLGVAYNGGEKSGRLYKKLKEIKFPGFKKGGVVSVDDIEKQVHDNGDDGIVSVKNGEGILTQKQTEALEEFTEKLPEKDGIIRTPDGVELTPVSPEDFIKMLQARSADKQTPDLGGMAKPDLQDLSGFMKPILPDLSGMVKFEPPEVPSAGNTNNVLNIDNITLPNVTNAEEFADTLIPVFQRKKGFERLLDHMITERLTGAGKLNKYRPL